METGQDKNHLVMNCGQKPSETHLEVCRNKVELVPGRYTDTPPKQPCQTTPSQNCLSQRLSFRVVKMSSIEVKPIPQNITHLLLQSEPTHFPLEKGNE